MNKIREYADYYGVTMLEAYMELIDMGEIRESEYLRKKCEKLSK